MPVNKKISSKYLLYMFLYSTYIGQTRRNLLSRIKEHATSEKSEVCIRLLQNPTHRLDFNTLTILGS